MVWCKVEVSIGVCRFFVNHGWKCSVVCSDVVLLATVSRDQNVKERERRVMFHFHIKLYNTNILNWGICEIWLCVLCWRCRRYRLHISAKVKVESEMLWWLCVRCVPCRCSLWQARCKNPWVCQRSAYRENFWKKKW